MVKIKSWYMNLSIKKSFIALTVSAIIIALLLSIISVTVIFYISQVYYGSTNYRYRTIDSDSNSEGMKAEIAEIEEQKKNKIKNSEEILTFLSILMILVPIIIFFITMIATAFIFYRTKLEKPLHILTQGAEKIANKELNFTVEYDSNDEMGYLCNTFENMRREILSRYKYEWHMKEERKRVNRAFSHDLRTPVTIMKGHLDVMNNNLEKDDINKDKLQSTVKLLKSNVGRIETYIKTMDSIERLNDIEPKRKEIDVSEFIHNITHDFSLYARKNNREIKITNHITSGKLYFDPEIVIRVLENIVSNSVRYSKEIIQLDVTEESPYLIFNIIDDGEGFNFQDIKMVLKPFYKDKRNTSSEHLGLGLYISSILCDKHGGDIELLDNTLKGGHVRVSFMLGDKEEV